MLSLLNVKGGVSTEVGSDSYTHLHSVQQTLGASSGHQKYLGDLSSLEGAGRHTQHERQLFYAAAQGTVRMNSTRETSFPVNFKTWAAMTGSIDCHFGNSQRTGI